MGEVAEGDGAASSAAMAAEFAALRAAFVEAMPSAPGGAARYVFGEVFARGGLGQVRRAFDSVLGRTIAVKEMLSPGGSERFIREAQVTARLDHPAIVPVHDLGVHANGQPFYCMKLIDGRTLDAVIAETRTLAERIVLLPHIVTVAEAVAFAHSKGVLHRDLKPANILVGNFGETWIIDWGLTGYLENEDPPTTHEPSGASEADRARLTRTGEWLGTLPYMAPEQRCGRSIDERADVYGLGAVLYHTLSGQRPYGDANVDELPQWVMERAPEDLGRLMPETPPELLAIVRKAMAREEVERYPDMRSLIDDIRRFLGGRLVDAHRYRALDVIRRWARRHRPVLMAVAAAGLVLVIAGIYGVRRIADERDAALMHRAAAEAARDEAERSGDEAREALATRWEDVGSRELIAARRPLDAIEPLRRALELAPDRQHLRTMLATARRPLDALRCEANVARTDAVVVHPTLPRMALGRMGRLSVELWSTKECTMEQVVEFPEKFAELRFSDDGAALTAITEGGPRAVFRYPLAAGTTLERSLALQPDPIAVDEVKFEGCGRAPRGDDSHTWKRVRHPSGVVVVLDRRGDVRVWGANTGACLGVVSGFRVTKWRIVDIDGVTRLLTLDGDARLSVWQLGAAMDLTPEVTLNLDESGIFDFDANDSGVLVTLGREGMVLSWDLAALLGTPPFIHASLIALRPDGGAAAISDGMSVDLIDPGSGDRLGPSWDIAGLEVLGWSPDGRLTARRGTELMDWNPDSPDLPVALDVGPRFSARKLVHDAVAGTPLVVVRGFLATDHDKYDLQVYDTQNDRWLTFDAAGEQSYRSARTSVARNGTRALLGNGALIDTSTRAVIAWLDDSAVFSADGAEVLSLTHGARGLHRYDARTGHALGVVDSDVSMPHRTRGLADTFRAAPLSPVDRRVAVYSPSGATFATTGPGMTVTLWDEQRREERVALDGHRLPTYSVLWNPDESRVLTFGSDNVATLWDSESGQRYADYENVWRGARAVFSLVGQRLALQEGADRVAVIDTASGARLFGIATETLEAMAMTPDGSLLILVEAAPGAGMSLRVLLLEEAFVAAG